MGTLMGFIYANYLLQLLCQILALLFIIIFQYVIHSALKPPGSIIFTEEWFLYIILASSI